MGKLKAYNPETGQWEAVSGSAGGSGAVTDIRDLTINGVSYDGSADIDMTDTINTMIDMKLGVIEHGAY